MKVKSSILILVTLLEKSICPHSKKIINLESYSYDNGDDSKDAKSIADKLIETLRNDFSDDPLFIFNEDTVKHVNELCESLSSNQCNPDAAVNTNIVCIVYYMRNYQI